MFKYINDNICFQTINELFEHYHLSKKNRYLLLTNENVKVNDVIVKNGEYKLKKNDQIIISEDAISKNTYIPFDYKLNILYEDDNLLIVYKPISMLVHPDGNRNDTLMNAVANYFKGSDIYFSHLHRLDYETSGMILISKNIFYESYLSYEWENKHILKRYNCLCEGIFGKKQDFINYEIGKDRHKNNVQFVNKQRRTNDCITKYQVIEEFKNKSKLDVEIIGGKHHQIRAHMQAINHPIIGDEIYGAKNDRMYLQFYHIEFTNPKDDTLFSFDIKKEF